MAPLRHPLELDDEARASLAKAIADEIIDRIMRYGGRYALFMFPDGSSKTFPSEGKRERATADKWPGALVGTYDAGSSAQQIVSDILERKS
jgi:hypothetical protein